MTYQELRKIEISSLLDHLGFQPVKQAHNVVWYKSPIREERTPSFKVDLYKNQWYDFGEGRGGDVIKLATLIWNENEKDAIFRLNQIYGLDSQISLKTALAIEPVDNEITVMKDCKIDTVSLYTYLRIRKIPIHFALHFLREVHYIVGNFDREYLALGLKNDMGGFELRNKVKGVDYKRSTRPKYFSTVYRTESKELNLFEGMFDFLSALAYSKGYPTNTTIVLNSITQIDHVIPLLAVFEKINLYLDNDDAGEKTCEKIMAVHANAINYSKVLFPDFKDFNEFICKRVT
jgi:DNA primase